MCSYERAGWLGSRDLGWNNQEFGKRASREQRKLTMHLTYAQMLATAVHENIKLEVNSNTP